MKREETTEDGAYKIILYTCPVQESCVILTQEFYKGAELNNRNMLTLCPEDMKSLIKEFKKYTK